MQHSSSRATCVRSAALLLAVAALGCQSLPTVEDRLPSWNEGAAKAAIVAFVERTTKQGSPEYVPPAERIAVFDNDGTLWGEQPLYFQLVFALDRVKALAPQHPEWKTQEPFASLLQATPRRCSAAG